MVKVATGFVIYRNISDAIEYLLLQASYGVFHWSPPKGHVDPGETELQTAYRETEEEAGLEKSDLRVIDGLKRTINYRVDGKPKTVHYWLAELINPNARVRLSDEHQAYKWFKYDEAYETVVFKDMQKTLAYFNNYLTN